MSYILINSEGTYFDILPQELNLLVISKININDLYKFKDI